MKIFKDKRNGEHWQASTLQEDIDRCEEGKIMVFPLGGGFLHQIPAEELEEVEMPSEVISGWATFDDEENVYRCLYNPHDRWNGWHQPVFSKPVFDIIVNNWNSQLVKGSPFCEDNGNIEFYTLVHEDGDIEDGITVVHNIRDDVWGLDGVTWICMTDEELESFGSRWEINHVRNQ